MQEYNHKPREKRLKEIIIGQGVVILLIVVVSLSLVFWGLGYKVNWKNFTIKHTGIIYLSYAPKDARVFIDDTEYKQSSPLDVQEYAGRYNLVIKKAGFSDWTQLVKVENDRVISFRNIVLFRASPEISEITDQDSKNSIDAPYDTLVTNPNGDLVANDYEIWNGDDLVTRLATPISSVIWYPGNEYIAFQQGNEIRIIEKNGTNDNLLVKLNFPSKTKFIFSWDGSSLLYRDGDKYYQANIN